MIVSPPTADLPVAAPPAGASEPPMGDAPFDDVLATYLDPESTSQAGGPDEHGAEAQTNGDKNAPGTESKVEGQTEASADDNIADKQSSDTTASDGEAPGVIAGQGINPAPHPDPAVTTVGPSLALDLAAEREAEPGGVAPLASNSPATVAPVDDRPSGTNTNPPPNPGLSPTIGPSPATVSPQRGEERRPITPVALNLDTSAVVDADAPPPPVEHAGVGGGQGTAPTTGHQALASPDQIDTPTSGPQLGRAAGAAPRPTGTDDGPSTPNANHPRDPGLPHRTGTAAAAPAPPTGADRSSASQPVDGIPAGTTAAQSPTTGSTMATPTPPTGGHNGSSPGEQGPPALADGGDVIQQVGELIGADVATYNLDDAEAAEGSESTPPSQRRLSEAVPGAAGAQQQNRDPEGRDGRAARQPVSPAVASTPSESSPVDVASGAQSVTVDLGAMPSGPTSSSDSAPAQRPGALPATLRTQIDTMRHAGDTQRRLVVRLDPPELGAVTLELVNTGDELLITARTDTQDAVRALIRQREEIQTVIEALGMSLGGFDVREESQPEGENPRRTRRGGRTSLYTNTDPADIPAGGDPEGALFL